MEGESCVNSKVGGYEMVLAVVGCVTGRVNKNVEPWLIWLSTRTVPP